MQEYLRDCSAEDAVSVLTAVFEQCFLMDGLGVSKQEMGWPEHHVLVSQRFSHICDTATL